MVFKSLREDIDAFMARDPAARSRLEIVLCYPGLHALLLFRLSSALWQRRLFLLARVLSQFGRLTTGIEIHPGATIGRRFVIDHGFGVVIGETAEIGDDVTLYQGVTLGGIAPSVDSRAQVNVKRHPTLQAGVIVGSGAQILGPITVGERARVGANSVVTRDVPPGVTAVGIPAHTVAARDRGERFSAYGTPAGGCPDPVLATIEALGDRVAALVEQVERLQGGTDVLRGPMESPAPAPIDGAYRPQPPHGTIDHNGTDHNGTAGSELSPGIVVRPGSTTSSDGIEHADDHGRRETGDRSARQGG